MTVMMAVMMVMMMMMIVMTAAVSTVSLESRFGVNVALWGLVGRCDGVADLGARTPHFWRADGNLEGVLMIDTLRGEVAG